MVEKNIPTSFITGSGASGQTSQSESRPVPDPTVLTTQQLLREVAMLRDVLETRLNGMDKAIDLLQVATDKLPEKIHPSVARLQELHEEKFNSIKIQFEDRDTRANQTTADSKVAIGAALQAAKEAVGAQNESNSLAIAKSEAGFTKQIDQIGVLLQSMSKNTDEKINDIRGRVQAIESTKKGFSELWGVLAGAIAIILAIVGIIMSTVRTMPHVAT